MSTTIKSRMLLTCLLTAVVILAAGIWQEVTRGPIYQRKPLSVWLADLDARASGAQRFEAREAVWTLGTNALGPLPNMLRSRDWLPRNILISLNEFGATRSAVRFHVTTAVELHLRALTAYGFLGEIASPDVPLLSRMVVEETCPEVRLLAARALHCINPSGSDAAPAVAALSRATRDTDSAVRCASTLALVVISPHDKVLAPVLVERLSDPHAQTREIARHGLLGLGDAAILTLRDAGQTNQVAVEVLQELDARNWYLGHHGGVRPL